MMSQGEARTGLTTKDVVFGSGVFPLLMVGLFSGLDVWWRSPEVIPFPWNLLGIPFLLGGLALGGWCLQTVRRMPPGAMLVTWGPWGLSRHPIYLGGQLVNLGITVFVGSLALLVGLALHMALDRLASRLEERGLRQRFGERYEAYAESVPRWLPRPHPRRPIGDPVWDADDPTLG
jgi:protein-S-isoprenylcysteine O-methyltransferase Ste14